MLVKGWTNSDGTTQESVPEKAIGYYQAAEQEDADAQFNLGRMWYKGWTNSNGVQQAPDKNRAILYLTMAAQQGQVAAQNNLKALEEQG